MAHSLKANSILYFVKYPEPGMVKTRLAKSIGSCEAARVYRELAESNLLKLVPLAENGVSITIAFDPPEKEAEVKRWLPRGFFYVAQTGATLGERLQNAFSHAFEMGAKKVLALGSDTMGLTADVVEAAFDALDRRDVVLGPTEDGGYYLIGLNQCVPEIFQHIPWSTPRVLSETISRGTELRLSYQLIDELCDLDEVKDLKRKEACL